MNEESLYTHGHSARKAAGESQILIVLREKRRHASDAFHFWHILRRDGERKKTKSRARMTPPATSAATSAGEARPDGLGAMLGHVGAPQDLSVV